MKSMINEVRRMQVLAGIITEAEAGVNVINNPIVKKQAPQAPAPKKAEPEAPKSVDPTKVDWKYAGSEKTDNKKKYVLRAILNDKPAAYASLDITSADPKKAVFADKQIDSLVDSLKRSNINTGVDWNVKVKVKLQVVDTETNKVINNYDLTKDGGLKSLGITGGGSYMGAV